MLWEVATQIGLHRFLRWELVKTTRFGGFNDLFLTKKTLTLGDAILPNLTNMFFKWVVQSPTTVDYLGGGFK